MNCGYGWLYIVKKYWLSNSCNVTQINGFESQLENKTGNGRSSFTMSVSLIGQLMLPFEISMKYCTKSSMADSLPINVHITNGLPLKWIKIICILIDYLD